jgi:hypothetical protein
MQIVEIDIAKVNLDTTTDEGQFNNLLLNLMGGLRFSDLTDEDKALCAKFGYTPTP